MKKFIFITIFSFHCSNENQIYDQYLLSFFDCKKNANKVLSLTKTMEIIVFYYLKKKNKEDLKKIPFFYLDPKFFLQFLKIVDVNQLSSIFKNEYININNKFLKLKKISFNRANHILDYIKNQSIKIKDPSDLLILFLMINLVRIIITELFYNEYNFTGEENYLFFYEKFISKDINDYLLGKNPEIDQSFLCQRIVGYAPTFEVILLSEDKISEKFHDYKIISSKIYDQVYNIIKLFNGFFSDAIKNFKEPVEFKTFISYLNQHKNLCKEYISQMQFMLKINNILSSILFAQNEGSLKENDIMYWDLLELCLEKIDLFKNKNNNENNINQEKVLIFNKFHDELKVVRNNLKAMAMIFTTIQKNLISLTSSILTKEVINELMENYLEHLNLYLLLRYKNTQFQKKYENFFKNKDLYSKFSLITKELAEEYKIIFNGMTDESDSDEVILNNNKIYEYYCKINGLSNNKIEN
jgi:hypothetical protein